MSYTRTLIAIAVSTALSAPTLAADSEMAVLKAEFKRLAQRIETLERQNQELEKALASDRVSDREPELATRLKTIETQAQALKEQSKPFAALEGIELEASLTGVAQKVGSRDTASGAAESRLNYRGDIAVTLPGGDIGDSEGKIFAHLRFGQGAGIGLRPTYSSGANSTAFQTTAGADDSFAILAQAWYQIKVPLMSDGVKANAREHVHLTAGKIDSFVFFDQNGAADDESAKFMNNVFVHNPLLDSGGDIRADTYGFAPGAIAQYVNEGDRGSEWGLSLGVFGSGPGTNFSGSMGKPYVIAQAETAARFNHLPGKYRMYLWRSGRGSNYDGIERKHSGVGFSADQKVTENLTLFGRYGHQLKGKVRFDRALTLGGELAGSSWGRATDGIGLAFGALRTSSDFRNDSLTIDANADATPDFGYLASGSEKQFEMYYRYQINDKVELTPDFQMISRPGGNGGASTVKVLGLRAKVGF
ncbi:MAG: carbohydrate porin [Sulfuritalea sp.]|nr:carbohydrate porin [Sulfuritalea sp.]